MKNRARLPPKLGDIDKGRSRRVGDPAYKGRGVASWCVCRPRNLMRRRLGCLSVWSLALVCFQGLATVRAAEPMIVEGPTGPVTIKEISAFKNFMKDVPPATNNIGNAMVYGGSGEAAEALGRVFEISGDVELLNRMLVFTDRMLAGRNDPKTGAVIWTGARELVWPNQAPKDGKPLYSSTENGDVIGHIAYAARLILENKKLWSDKVPGGDPFGFGATYRERAATYVREMDRTLDTFILKWLVRPDTHRCYSPDSPLYESVARPGSANQPVPWNQQTMLLNGFQRLAECHHLLGDDAARAQRYNTIVKAAVDWFFEAVERYEAKGKLCYKWTYVFEKPLRHIEDTGHGGYDVAGLARAYVSGRYGLTAEQMRPLANTVSCVLQQPGNKFMGRVDGTPGKHPPGGLGGSWIDLCEFQPELLPVFIAANQGRIKSSPGLVANLLWAKHRLQLTQKKQP